MRQLIFGILLVGGICFGSSISNFMWTRESPGIPISPLVLPSGQTPSSTPAVFDFALFSNIDIEIKGSSSIWGPVRTSATSEHSVRLGPADGNRIFGPLTIGLNGIPNTVVDRPGKVNGGIVPAEDVCSYHSPDYRHFDNLIISGNPTHANFNPTIPYTEISESSYFESFYVTGNIDVLINTGTQDMIIQTKNFTLSAGHLILLGTGRLILIVQSSFTLSGSSSINNNGKEQNDRPLNSISDLVSDPNRFILYYTGIDQLNLGTGKDRIIGSVMSRSAPISAGGSSQVFGNIFSDTSGLINIFGSVAPNLTGLLYAPNANVKIIGSANIKGSVVAKTIEIGSGTQCGIEYEFLPFDLPIFIPEANCIIP